jgi:hypothetical protein
VLKEQHYDLQSPVVYAAGLYSLTNEGRLLVPSHEAFGKKDVL